MFNFYVDYYLACLLASYAVIQIASLRATHMIPRLFQGVFKTVFLSLLLLIMGFSGFFLTEDRNINDYEGGLDANQQAILFSLAIVSSLWVNRLGRIIKDAIKN